MATWDEQRSLFLKTERKISTNLSKFDQFLFNLEQTTRSISSTSSLNYDEWQVNLQRFELDIQELLNQLRQISTWLKSETHSNPPSDPSRQYALRSDDILRKLSGDLRHSIQRGSVALNRLFLLGPRGSIEEGASDTELLIKENNNLNASLQTMDRTISAAQKSKQSLSFQRDVLGTVVGKLKLVGEKFPQIGNVIGRIQRYRQRDMLILAVVVATCLFLIFLYIINKT